MKDVVFVNNLTDFSKTIKDGQLYKLGNHTSTLITKECIYKDAMGFDNDCGLAEKCLKIWKQKGRKGNPSSPASFFKYAMSEKLKLKAHENKIFSERFHGGWVETIKPGITRVKTYHYDIKKAYYWAGSIPLPREIRPLQNTKDPFICIFRQSKIPENVPNRFERKLVTVTKKDIETFGLQGEIVKGFNLYDFSYVPKNDVDKLDFLPERAFKRVTQSYWGIWASRKPLKRVVRKGAKEKVYSMYNYFQNFVYAQIIVNRVIRRVYQYIDCKPISVCVDAILSEQPIPTGEKIGDFVLKNIFDDGVYVESAGRWTPLPNVPKNRAQWHKHSGFSAVN